MPVSKSIAYQHVLCMDLRQDKLTVAAVNKSDKRIAAVEVFTDFEFSRTGMEQILSADFFRYDFADFVLTAGAIRNTLVPTTIFNESKPEELFRFNYTDPIDNLDYNRIPELDIVNIYELPLWIKSAFVIRIPRVKILHRTSVLLKGIFDQPVYSPKVHLFVEEENFYLFVTGKNKLQYFNLFYYKNLSDLVYHVLFVMEQKEIAQEDAQVHLYGTPGNWSPLKELQTYFKQELKVSEQPEKGEHFMLAKQLLCV